jgi:general secretion pathway protein F
MPLFRYKAAAPGGEILEGDMAGDDRAAVVQRLQSQGYVPIRVEEASARSGSLFGWSGMSALFGRGHSVGPEEIAVLTNEIATLLRAGLPLDRAFSVLTDISDEGAVRDLISRLQEAVRGGSSLTEAMEAQGSVFSGFYVSMIRAGEAGGALDEILARVSEFLERSRALRNTVNSALIYPAILLGVSALSVVILLTFVVPQFEQLFEDAGQALPLMTQVVIAAGEVLQGYWWALLLGILAVVLLVRHQLENPANRYRWDRSMLRLPLVGELIAEIEMSRLCRTLGTLLVNGVPLLAALEIVKGTLTNRVMTEAIGNVAVSLREGQGMAEPLQETSLFPKMGVQMIKVGEETGQLETMLEQVADTYDVKVQTTVKRMLALMEPVLILGLGVVIAFIIISILVAILSVNELAF